MTTNEQYHADPAISASHLKAVMQSPYHYWSRFLDPQRPTVEPTSAMRLGSLAHCAVLEPDELSKRYAIAPDRRSNAGKAAAAEMSANGIEAVSEPEMALALSMADAVRQHPYAAALLADGKAEQSFWWDDKATGQRCKCRPDWYQGTTIVDLKTCQDASPNAFARACATFAYHTQAAHYLNGTFADRFRIRSRREDLPVLPLASTSWMLLLWMLVLSNAVSACKPSATAAPLMSGLVTPPPATPSQCPTGRCLPPQLLISDEHFPSMAAHSCSSSGLRLQPKSLKTLPRFSRRVSCRRRTLHPWLQP
jgi:hypothetical protein